MGYYTDFTLKMEIKKPDYRFTQAAKDITSFLVRAGFETNEHTVGRLIAENVKHFNLGGINESDVIKELTELSGYEGWYEDSEGEWILNEAKWYDREKHMKVLSKKYPEVTFALNGEGEEQGDVWREVWINGSVKRQQAKLVFEDE